MKEATVPLTKVDAADLKLPDFSRVLSSSSSTLSIKEDSSPSVIPDTPQSPDTSSSGSEKVSFSKLFY